MVIKTCLGRDSTKWDKNYRPLELFRSNKQIRQITNDIIPATILAIILAIIPAINNGQVATVKQ